MDVKKITEKLKGLGSKKTTGILAAVLACAIVALVLLSILPSGTDKSAASSLNDGLEARLEKTLSCMNGVGDVSVVINYESSSELVPATSIDTVSDESGGSERVEVASISGDALIIKENMPEVRGVIVVAEGAEDIGVRMELLSAVSTLLGITNDRIEILY